MIRKIIKIFPHSIPIGIIKFEKTAEAKCIDEIIQIEMAKQKDKENDILIQYLEEYFAENRTTKT